MASYNFVVPAAMNLLAWDNISGELESLISHSQNFYRGPQLTGSHSKLWIPKLQPTCPLSYCPSMPTCPGIQRKSSLYLRANPLRFFFYIFPSLIRSSNPWTQTGYSKIFSPLYAFPSSAQNVPKVIDFSLFKPSSGRLFCSCLEPSEFQHSTLFLS